MVKRLILVCVVWLLAASFSQAAVNIALNATPTASGPGWGAGTNLGDIVDGNRSYDTDAHGLALPWPPITGGQWGTEWVAVDFGTTQVFDTVTLWHHGDTRVPSTASLDYWDGSAWNSISSYDRTIGAITYGGAGSSLSDAYVFAAPVTGSQVRWSYDSYPLHLATGQHAWIYEFEVSNSAVPEPATVVIWSLLGALGFTFGVYRRRKAA